MQATQKYIRTSPRKLRLVADAVRGLRADLALDYLRFLGKRASLPVAKVIRSAVTSAKNEQNIEASKLVVKIIDVGEGPTYKRWRAVSRGSAHSIMKRTSHIKVVLESENGPKS